MNTSSQFYFIGHNISLGLTHHQVVHKLIKENFLPSHILPLPTYPSLHSHLNPPGVLVQLASGWQGGDVTQFSPLPSQILIPTSHSSMSSHCSSQTVSTKPNPFNSKFSIVSCVNNNWFYCSRKKLCQW